MVSAPQLSVILPIHNGGKYLRDAIQSVMQQTFQDFELIAIDDGSTDNTLQILQEFKDPRVRIFSQENSGLVTTLQRGMRLACAPLIARMDHDDKCMPNRFALQVQFLQEHPEVGVCGGAVILESNGRQRVARFPETDTGIRWLFCFTSSIVHPAVIFRKTVIEQVNGYRQSEESNLTEDYDLWVRLTPITKFANLHQPVLMLRKHGKNITISSSQKHLRNSQRISQNYVQNIIKHAVPITDIAKLRHESSPVKDIMSAYTTLRELYMKFISEAATKDEVDFIRDDYTKRLMQLASNTLNKNQRKEVFRTVWQVKPTSIIRHYINSWAARVATLRTRGESFTRE